MPSMVIVKAADISGASLPAAGQRAGADSGDPQLGMPARRLAGGEPARYRFRLDHRRPGEAEDLPTFGGFKDGTFDVEQAAPLNPDVVLMNLEAKPATEHAGYDDKLAELGIPIVYVDFREDPMAHSLQSMRIMGQLIGQDTKAEEFTPSARAQSRRSQRRTAADGRRGAGAGPADPAAGRADLGA